MYENDQTRDRRGVEELTFLPASSVTAEPESEKARDQSEILKICEDPNLCPAPPNEKNLDIEGGKANQKKRQENPLARFAFDRKETEKSWYAFAVRQV